MCEVQDTSRYRILIGCTGSVASVKIPILLRKIQEMDFGKPIDIKLVATQHSFHFFDEKSVPATVTIHKDEDEWNTWSLMGDPVLHIELRRWADIFVVAPLDANTLAKLATGICDNLLTCVARAWDTTKPLAVCPAMNTYMWDHPITEQQMGVLHQLGYHEIKCVSKKLACGEIGFGGMAEVPDIVSEMKRLLEGGGAVNGIA